MDAFPNFTFPPNGRRKQRPNVKQITRYNYKKLQVAETRDQMQTTTKCKTSIHVVNELCGKRGNNKSKNNEKDEPMTHISQLPYVINSSIKYLLSTSAFNK